MLGDTLAQTLIDTNDILPTPKEIAYSRKNSPIYNLQKSDKPYHSLDIHKRLDCSACHASWQPSRYELSVFRDDTAGYKKWRDLTVQEDKYLENFLKKVLKSEKKPPPQMPDWITGKMKKGIWYSGWRYRRWENLILGNSSDGKIKILRPMFQYRISYRDSNGTMILDDENELETFVPYDPYTTTAKSKLCEMCHENPLLLNLTKKKWYGDGFDKTKSYLKRISTNKRSDE